MVLTKIGASLGGSADTITVTQGSHGFGNADRGKAVKMTDSSGTPTYALATANTVANADAIGIITQIIDATKFIIALSGRITVDAAIITYGGSPVAGTVLFLPTASALGVANSVQNSGHLTPTEPSGTSEVSKPMAVVTVAGSEMVMLQQRGEVIGSGATTVADGSITLAKMAANSVGAAQYVDASIDTEHIANAAITNSKIDSDAVLATQIGANAVGDTQLYKGAVSDQSAKTTVVDADVILLSDSEDSSNLKKMTRANFVAGVGATLTGNLQDFVEGGNDRTIYNLGMADKTQITASAFDIGHGFTSRISGSGNIDNSATLQGGWDLACSAGAFHDTGIHTTFSHNPADDWVMMCRFVMSSASDQRFIFGLHEDISGLRSTNDICAFFVEGTGAITGVCDNGGTEATRVSSTTPNGSTVHTLRIEISSGGTVVKFFVDNVQVGANVTGSSIPTDTSMEFLIGVGNGGGSTATTAHVSDVFAWRDT